MPKNCNPVSPNDFRPIALTSILCKCMERVVLGHQPNIHLSDQLQFAYKAQIGTEDATLTLLHVISKHIQHPGAFARISFIDLSSAFNTVKTDILLDRLLKRDTSGHLVLWIKDFLTDSPQRVLCRVTCLMTLF